MHSEPSSYYETGDTGSETSVSATRGKLLHVLMRDEKEKRKKQARSNHRSRSMVKQTNKAKQHVQVRTYDWIKFVQESVCRTPSHSPFQWCMLTASTDDDNAAVLLHRIIELYVTTRVFICKLMLYK